MNYRHAFHAGNHADVLKHVVLALCLRHLRLKAKPFAVVDAFAGVGLYDLAGDAASRTGEAADGVGRVLDAPDPPAALGPWSEAVQAARRETGLATAYPGSPWIARAALREGDRLIECERHPQDLEDLRAVMGRDRRVRALDHDGWQAVRAFLPPPERRGLLLIDPPFEAEDEFARLVEAVADARRRWATGMVMVWGPVKDRAALAGFFTAAGEVIGAALKVTLMIRDAPREARLDGSALLVINPPWTLAEDLRAAGPWLANALAQGPGARFGIEEIRPKAEAR